MDAQHRQGFHRSRRHPGGRAPGAEAAAGGLEDARPQHSSSWLSRDPGGPAGGRMGVIESVKAASDLYSPVAGEVTAVNQELKDHPEYVNEDPYGKGWIVKLRGAKDNPKLLDQKAYDNFVQGQSPS